MPNDGVLGPMLWEIDVARGSVTLLFRRERQSYLYAQMLDEMPRDQHAAERFVVAWKASLTPAEIAAMEAAAIRA